MAKEIREDEWLAELDRLGVTSEAEGMTAQEMADKCGKCSQWVRGRLKHGLEDGSFVRGHASRECIDGITRRRPVYRRVKK